MIKALAAQGKVQPLKRSIRFLFVPEISGTAAYLKKYPDIAKRFFANINHDMVGEGLMQERDRLPARPEPVFASDLPERRGRPLRHLGGRDPAAVPGVRLAGDAHSGPGGLARSLPLYDRSLFREAAITWCSSTGASASRRPTSNVWPDQWYHTSGDTIDKSDSTQFKRVVVISAAMALFMANAGGPGGRSDDGRGRLAAVGPPRSGRRARPKG